MDFCFKFWRYFMDLLSKWKLNLFVLIFAFALSGCGDSPDDIYKNPRNIFVAEFIGNPKMNIIKIDKKDIINKNTFKLLNSNIHFEN